MAEPLIEAEQVSEIAFGFMASKALFVALHLDLFTHIAAPVSYTHLTLPTKRIV